MKPATTALIALLGTGSFVTADLYTLTLSDGTVLRYATSDIDISVAIDIFAEADIFATADIFLAYTWSSDGPRFDDASARARGRWKVGLDVDTWQVRVMPRSVDPLTGELFPDKIGTTAWLTAAAAGFLDGAVVQVDRAFLAEWPSPWVHSTEALPAEVITMFLGRMAEVDVARSFAVLNINDFRELLNMQMPRNLYQSGCRFTLYGAGCGLDSATFLDSGSVGAGSSGNAINAALPHAAGYFDLGRLTMTSGPNTGFQRQVRSWDGATLKLIAPFFFDLSVGETFDIVPGCNKTLDTCTNTFGNQLNFGGQPFIPAPATAI